MDAGVTLPQAARLVTSFPLGNFGASVACMADINNDGRQELLFLQTAGQLRSRLYDKRRATLGVDEVDQSLYCLTAVDLAGKVLWQDGTPYSRDVPYTGHGGDTMLLADDVDGDGRVEVAVVRNMELALLDGSTGRCKKAVSLPTDNLVSLFSARVGPRQAGRRLIIKVNDAGYPPWQYSNPTMVFNPDLSVFKDGFALRGAGHNVIAADINGDGYDEFFIGYSLLDRDFNEVWRLDFGPDFDYVVDHADDIVLADINGDGKPEVLYAGSEDFVVTDVAGKILWRTHAGHSQNSIAGPWGPRGEMRIVMNEKNLGVWCLDGGGRILWHRTDINGYALNDVRWSREGMRRNWPLFRPQLKRAAAAPYESDPSDSRRLWPQFLGDDGAPLDVFPWRAEYAQPKRTIRALRSYDSDVGYHMAVGDIDGDGLDEVVVYDRLRATVFHSPE